MTDVSSMLDSCLTWIKKRLERVSLLTMKGRRDKTHQRQRSWVRTLREWAMNWPRDIFRKETTQEECTRLLSSVQETTTGVYHSWKSGMHTFSLTIASMKNTPCNWSERSMQETIHDTFHDTFWYRTCLLLLIPCNALFLILLLYSLVYSFLWNVSSSLRLLYLVNHDFLVVSNSFFSLCPPLSIVSLFEEETRVFSGGGLWLLALLSLWFCSLFFMQMSSHLQCKGISLSKLQLTLFPSPTENLSCLRLFLLLWSLFSWSH